MTTTNQIRDTVGQLLKGKYPDRTQYVNRCPKDFARPSFWIEVAKDKQDDVNWSTIRHQVHFLLTCFVFMDSFNNGDDLELTDLQDAVIGLFSAGYIRVGDRAIKVSASAGGHDNDRSYVDLQFDYFDDRPLVEEDLPIAASVDLAINNKEES